MSRNGVTCISCSSTVYGTSIFTTSSCSHSTCLSCQQNWAREKINTTFGIVIKVPCIICQADLPLADIRRSIASSDAPPRLRLQAIEDRKAQFQTDLKTNGIRCPARPTKRRCCKRGFLWCCRPARCSGFAPLGSGNDGQWSLQCLDCGHRWNLQKWYHCGRRPGGVSQAALAKVAEDRASDVWKDSNTKKCPHCLSPIQKNEGCNHMTCSRCSGQFCWICVRKWDQCPSKPCANPPGYNNYNNNNFDNGNWRWQSPRITDRGMVMAAISILVVLCAMTGFTYKYSANGYIFCKFLWGLFAWSAAAFAMALGTIISFFWSYDKTPNSGSAVSPSFLLIPMYLVLYYYLSGYVVVRMAFAAIISIGAFIFIVEGIIPALYTWFNRTRHLSLCRRIIDAFPFCLFLIACFVVGGCIGTLIASPYIRWWTWHVIQFALYQAVGICSSWFLVSPMSRSWDVWNRWSDRSSNASVWIVFGVVMGVLAFVTSYSQWILAYTICLYTAARYFYEGVIEFKSFMVRTCRSSANSKKFDEDDSWMDSNSYRKPLLKKTKSGGRWRK